MGKVKTLLNSKNSFLKFISPHSSIAEALYCMSTQRTEYLIVVEDDHFLGVITEHDILTRAILKDLSLSKTPVSQLMNVLLPVASIDESIEDCLERMSQYNVRLLPVFEDGIHFKGVISSNDIFKEIALKRKEVFN